MINVSGNSIVICQDGQSGVMVSIGVCGTPEPGSNPGSGPSKNKGDER